MSDTWLGRVVMAAIALLILHAVATWTYAARMAGRRGRAWFVVPALLFTALPFEARLWTCYWPT